MCTSHRALSDDRQIIIDQCQECLNHAVAAGRAAFAAQHRVHRPCSDDPCDPPMTFGHLVEFLKGVNYPNRRLEPVPSQELARALIAADRQQRGRRVRGLFGGTTKYDGGWRLSDVTGSDDGRDIGGERVTLMADGTLVVERYSRAATTSRTVRRPRAILPGEIMALRTR
jgi:hypothetical protein